MTRLPAILLLLCGCASVDFEPVARVREGESQVTGRLIQICWDKPANGPTPTHYEVTRLVLSRDQIWVESRTWWTEWLEIAIEDEPREHRYAIRAHNQTGGSIPCVAYRSFAITGIRKVEQADPDAGTIIVGILVTFATTPGCEYWLEKSTDNGATWTEIGHVLAWDTEHSIGGDAASPNAIYRVWQRL